MKIRQVFVVIFALLSVTAIWLYRTRMEVAMKDWDPTTQADRSQALMFFMKGVEARTFSHGELSSVTRMGQIDWLESGDFTVKNGLQHWSFDADQGDIHLTTWIARGKANQTKRASNPIGGTIEFETLVFPEEVTVRRQGTGDVLITRQLNYDAQTRIAQTHSRLRLEGPNHSLEGDHGIFNLQNETMEIWGHVQGTIVPTQEAMNGFLFGKGDK